MEKGSVFGHENMGIVEKVGEAVNSIKVGDRVYTAGTVSGAYLMHHGLNLKLKGDYDSTSVILEKE